MAQVYLGTMVVPALTTDVQAKTTRLTADKSFLGREQKFDTCNSLQPHQVLDIHVGTHMLMLQVFRVTLCPHAHKPHTD